MTGDGLESQHDTRKDLRKAILYIVLSALAFAFAGVIIRLMQSDMSVVALVFWRNVFSFLALIGWFVFLGFPSLRTKRFATHTWRSLFTYGALLAYFYALGQIPLANAVLLQSSAPIFVPLLALLIYRRLSDRYVWVGSLVGFVGVALIVLPSDLGISLGDASGVLSGVFGGLATVAIWSLSSSEEPARQMFYFTTLTLAFSFVPLPWFWEVPSISAIPALVSLGILTMLAQHFLAMGCVTASTDKIITWSYTSVIFSVCLGYALWGEVIALVGIAGMILVVFGAHLTSRIRGVSSPRAVPLER